MEFEVTGKELQVFTTAYHWLTLQPKGGGQEVEITVIEDTDHTTGRKEYEVTGIETMPGSEEEMGVEDDAIAYVKENIDKILQETKDEVTVS